MNLDNIFKAIESKEEFKPTNSAMHQLDIAPETIEEITRKHAMNRINKLIKESLYMYLAGGYYEINPVIILDIADRIEDIKDHKLMMLIYNIFTHYRLYGEVSREIKPGYLLQIDDIYSGCLVSTPSTIEEACLDIIAIVKRLQKKHITISSNKGGNIPSFIFYYYSIVYASTVSLMIGVSVPLPPAKMA